MKGSNVIDNPFQMNDWDIGKFLKVVLTIQLAVWGAIGLDVAGLQIPILRQFIGFIYLTFVPGILILRILKLHKLGNIETLLYTVGLSVASVMFIGLFMNVVYPFFGISRPISITPLIITISILVLILCIISYVRDKDYSNPSFIDVGEILSPPVLFLCLIPFLAIFGTYLVNFHHNNIILMLLIVILALIAVLIGFDKFIPKNLYPLAVFVTAISLLYHSSLISMYLVEWADLAGEYWISNTVVMNSIWDPTIYSTCNAMLSLVMLAPIYSVISYMSIAWVFKIIYPLLFSLVPLGLYRVFQKQTNEKISFLSCFFFMSMFTFYVAMLGLNRQQIAELFLVLLILSMIDENIDKTHRSFLFIVFGVSLAVSHYALSYIYMACLIAAWLLLALAENHEIQKMRDNLHHKFSRYKDGKLAGNPISSKRKNRTISSTFILIFVVFTLTWYMYVSNSSAFNAAVSICGHIVSSIFTEFLDPGATQGLDIILMTPETPLGYLNKAVHFTTQFFIAVGIVVSLLKWKERDFNAEYFAFSIPFFGMCIASIIVPHFAASINTTRLYHIILLFLAPFCVIGGMWMLRVLSMSVRASWTSKSVRNSLRELYIFFVIYLFFNSGLIYEIAGNPSSFSLNQTAVNCPHFELQEVDAATWLTDNKVANIIAYSDLYNSYLFQMLTGHLSPLQGTDEVITPTAYRAYFFLGKENIIDGNIRLNDPMNSRMNYTLAPLQNLTFYNTLLNSNKIYNNGNAQVYYQ
ncbi:MAG: hypothetical protein C4B59_04795 [Candidatus Methanogaster sp.]|uniref:Uncharacterized protein n=1 Tax=Candidatus Methanogaster sp. TaxID=3386292 RepID=A0AC61L4I9_9EURY|nr:MAG: hypothetical protein C4B59_04795 [ANME-2 cluster archaeon]